MSTSNTTNRPFGETTGTARRPKQQLNAVALTYDLLGESTALIAEAGTVSDGRASKTLSKHPGLNVVVAALRRGTVIRQHQASAPATIQVISGAVRLQLPAGASELQPGGFATLAANVAHEVEAITDASLLISVATPG